MRTAIAVALALASTAAMGQDEARTWHLFTLTDKGVINLLHGLTKHECEFALHRAKGEPATDEEIAAKKKADEEEEKRREKERDELVKAHPICGKGGWYSLPPAEQTEWFRYCNSGSITFSGGTSFYSFTRAECFE